MILKWIYLKMLSRYYNALPNLSTLKQAVQQKVEGTVTEGVAIFPEKVVCTCIP